MSLKYLINEDDDYPNADKLHKGLANAKRLYATAVCCAYVRKVLCEVVRTRFLDVTSSGGAVVACMLMQRRGRSV